MPHAVGQASVALTKTKVQWFTVVVSVVVHAGLTATLSLFAYRSLAAREAASAVAPLPGALTALVPVELPIASGEIFVDEQPIDPIGDPPRLIAGAEVTRIDTGAAGHGGEITVQEPALNLADADERIRLSPDPLNRLDRDQLQRLRASRFRSSWEDRRSTTHPAELTLVVTGTGSVLERRPSAPVEPSRGALESPPSSAQGAILGMAANARAEEGEADPPPTGGDRRGSLDTSPGRGLLDGRPGRDHRSSAPTANARPAVTYGPVAVPASVRARPTDDADAQQEVATVVRALVHASSAGGLQGRGQGGSDGGGESASGALHASGSHSSPLGAGAGDVFDYWTSDPRLVPYFRRIHAKIDPLWADAFPKSALYDLKQGTVILDFTVFADGHAVVSWPPVRPSGIDAFDRNCADAIRRAAPFPPIPREVGAAELRIRAPFVANNPIVK